MAAKLQMSPIAGRLESLVRRLAEQAIVEIFRPAAHSGVSGINQETSER